LDPHLQVEDLRKYVFANHESIAKTIHDAIEYYLKSQRKGFEGGEQMSVIGLKELKFERESELEAILTENPNVIEEGLSVIDTQVITNSGRLDILGLDSGKALVVIELKIEESDEMLWQALDYYDWVFRNIDTVKRLYPNSEVDYGQTPRLMLIAPRFSEVIKRRAVYLEASVMIWSGPVA
jgi:hypothetical protein